MEHRGCCTFVHYVNGDCGSMPSGSEAAARQEPSKESSLGPLFKDKCDKYRTVARLGACL